MNRILLSVPHMSGSERGYVEEAFAQNWISTAGPNLAAFEADFSRRLGRPAVALASGTAAMHLGLRLLGVGAGDEVFCPTLTFVATANPIRYLGATPVFLDSERATWNLDPERLHAALRRRAARGRLPRAIVVVHLLGQPAEMEAILAAAAEFGLPVLEDAAEALGGEYRGRPLGALADIGVFSFNGNKIITSGGGGMLVARTEALVERARFWATQARDPAAWYEHSETGYNYRMSNVLAGIGRGQLEALDLRVRQRRAIAFRYRDAFADLPGLEFMPQSPNGLHTNWLSCVLVDETRCGSGRDAIMAALAAEGIEARPLWKPLHLQPLFHGAECIGGAVAEDLFRRGLCLPSSSSLSLEDQERVIAAVRRQVAAAAVVSE